MEKRGIPTEVGEKNREIRQQNKLIDQLEARLTRLNAWAQFEKKMDEVLIAKGEDVADPNLRYVLASRIFSSAVPPKRKDNRLKEGAGLLAVMQEYKTSRTLHPTLKPLSLLTPSFTPCAAGKERIRIFPLS